MNLRDEFAFKTLEIYLNQADVEMVEEDVNSEEIVSYIEDLEAMIRGAYQCADIMLAVREEEDTE